VVDKERLEQVGDSIPALSASFLQRSDLLKPAEVLFQNKCFIYSRICAEKGR